MTTLDEQLMDAVRRIYPDDTHPLERVRQLCRETFGSGPGYQLLSLLNAAVPPMMPSVIGTENDPASIGMREGRREFSALLYRYSGRNPDNTQDPAHHAPQKRNSRRSGRNAQG